MAIQGLQFFLVGGALQGVVLALLLATLEKAENESQPPGACPSACRIPTAVPPC